MKLVTGGAGFIGSHLVDSLVSKGLKVRVLDNFSSGREEFLEHHSGTNNVEIVVADLLDLDAVKEAMKGVHTVHHLAANPDIRLGTEITDTDLPICRSFDYFLDSKLLTHIQLKKYALLYRRGIYVGHQIESVYTI